MKNDIIVCKINHFGEIEYHFLDEFDRKGAPSRIYMSGFMTWRDTGLYICSNGSVGSSDGLRGYSKFCPLGII